MTGIIDWKKVKADGTQFAIIRAGYGQSTMDKQFVNNIKGAIANGLNVGLYWFIYASNVAEAVANADKCVEVILPYKNNITLNVWADWEYDSDKKAPGQTKANRTAIVKAFLDRLECKGFKVGVYANPDYMTSKFDMTQLQKYPLWLAKYSTSKGSYSPYMWQYSSKGSVNGISGNVDLNYLYDEVKEEYPVLHYGDKGESVKTLQRRLTIKGYPCGSIDGIFGKKTNDALILYKYGNERVEVDEHLWQCLLK